MDLLECPICLFLMSEPVTMSCGHTFCRRCVGGSLPPRCPSCKERFKQREVKSIGNNVLLIGVVEKCCPDETKVKCHVQEKLKANEFTEALRIATEGLDLGKGVKQQLGLLLLQLQNPIHVFSRPTRLQSCNAGVLILRMCM